MGILALFIPQIPRLEWRGHAWGQVNFVHFMLIKTISSKGILNPQCVILGLMCHSVIHQLGMEGMAGMEGYASVLWTCSLLILPSVWQHCFIIAVFRDEGKYVKPTSSSAKTSKSRHQKSVRGSHSPSSSPHLSEGRREKHSRSRSPQSSKYIRR